MLYQQLHWQKNIRRNSWLSYQSPTARHLISLSMRAGLWRSLFRHLTTSGVCTTSIETGSAACPSTRRNKPQHISKRFVRRHKGPLQEACAMDTFITTIVVAAALIFATATSPLGDELSVFRVGVLNDQSGLYSDIAGLGS